MRSKKNSIINLKILEIMKKLFIIAVAGVFTFASCGKKPQPVEPEIIQTEEQKCDSTHKCCKELTPEQKAEMDAWNNWDNQTPEKKAELVENRKACIDKMMAEKAGQCESTKEECPEKAAKCAEMKAKMDNWANLTVEEKKALLDEFKPCKKEGEGCCRGEKTEGCAGHDKK
ncbi:MAG: hypothetical protein LBV02_01920 [Bacteroidales bacterium]|nr:hypothetical protein [Bacteroidales bacterium]